MNWWKMFLLPKLWFGIDGDQLTGGGQSQDDGQAGQQDDGNAGDENKGKEGEQGNQETKDFVEFEGVKVSNEAFEKIAKERYKDRFEAFENKSKWQAENTKKAQELAEDRRIAEHYRQLSADPRFQEFMNQGAKPRNDFEAQRQAYVQKKQQAFPDVDPRFFASQFEDIWEMSGQRAQGSITPILKQQSEQWEAQFMKEHPLIQKNSEEYYKVAGLIGKGYDPEHAYNVVYRDQLINETVEGRLKERDAEAKRKLQSKPISSSSSGQKKTTSDESFEKAWAKHGD